MWIFHPRSAGQAIRHYRDRAGLTAVEMADQLGMCPTSYYKIERAQKTLSVAEIVSIANILKVHPNKLMRLEEVDE